MSTALCPSCRTIRSMRVAFSKRKVRDSDGCEKEIQTVSYHCESCGQFVRSEEGAPALPTR